MATIKKWGIKSIRDRIFMVKFTSIFLLLSFSILVKPIDNALSYLQQLNTEEIDLENQALVLQYLDTPLEINNLKEMI